MRFVFEIAYNCRPLDARLSITSATTVPTDRLPETIPAFFEAVTQPVEENAPKSRKPGPQAPLSIDVEDETYTLERDDMIDLVESQAPDDRILLRTVRVKDMILGVDRTSSHNEVSMKFVSVARAELTAQLVYEGPKITPRFWRELAKVARDVLPRSESLFTDRQYRL